MLIELPFEQILGEKARTEKAQYFHLLFPPPKVVLQGLILEWRHFLYFLFFMRFSCEETRLNSDAKTFVFTSILRNLALWSIALYAYCNSEFRRPSRPRLLLSSRLILSVKQKKKQKMQLK